MTNTRTSVSVFKMPTPESAKQMFLKKLDSQIVQLRTHVATQIVNNFRPGGFAVSIGDLPFEVSEPVLSELKELGWNVTILGDYNDSYYFSFGAN